jgi:hypothetical protein
MNPFERVLTGRLDLHRLDPAADLEELFAIFSDSAGWRDDPPERATESTGSASRRPRPRGGRGTLAQRDTAAIRVEGRASPGNGSDVVLDGGQVSAIRQR